MLANTDLASSVKCTSQCIDMWSTVESVNMEMYACGHARVRAAQAPKKYTVHTYSANTGTHTHTGTEEWQRRVSPVIIVLEDERSEAERGVEEFWRDRGRGGGEGVEGEKRVINMRKGWMLSFWDTSDCCHFSPTNCFVFFIYLFILSFLIQRHMLEVSVLMCWFVVLLNRTFLFIIKRLVSQVGLSWFRAPWRIKSSPFPR